jgi:hypothetical protein
MENNNISNNFGLQEMILDYHEYFLFSENIIYEIIIIKCKDKIIIETKNNFILNIFLIN